MGNVVVRYQVKPECVEENRRLVAEVFAELSEADPGGIRYVTFLLADGVTFVHAAAIDTEDGSNPLGSIQAFADFTHDLGDRCVEPPVAQNADVVGSYGL